jgi:hypothetical protein
MSSQQSLLEASKQQKTLRENRIRMAIAIVELIGLVVVCIVGAMQSTDPYASSV